MISLLTGKSLTILNGVHHVAKESLGVIPDTSISEQPCRRVTHIVERPGQRARVICATWCENSATLRPPLQLSSNVAVPLLSQVRLQCHHSDLDGTEKMEEDDARRIF